MFARLLVASLLPVLTSLELLGGHKVTLWDTETTVSASSGGEKGHPDERETKVEPANGDESLRRSVK
jgi:hypothetical protein